MRINFRYRDPGEPTNPDTRFVEALALALGLADGWGTGQGRLNAAPAVEWPQRAGGIGQGRDRIDMNKVDFLFQPREVR